MAVVLGGQSTRGFIAAFFDVHLVFWQMCWTSLLTTEELEDSSCSAVNWNLSVSPQLCPTNVSTAESGPRSPGEGLGYFHTALHVRWSLLL